jgi:hypothetical protein
VQRHAVEVCLLDLALLDDAGAYAAHRVASSKATS